MFQDAQQILHDVGVPVSQHHDAVLGKPLCARCVPLYCSLLRMLTAIEFDCEAQGRTIKIQHKGTGRMLPSEINAKLSIAQLLPEFHFDICLAVRGKRERLVAITERADRLESEQMARLTAARRAERAAIAAEMHDVLAHRLSMLSLHAGAIELHPDAPPSQLARRLRRSSACQRPRRNRGSAHGDGRAAQRRCVARHGRADSATDDLRSRRGHR